MSYPELNQYISKRLSQGATKEIIIEELLPNNWTKSDIDQAFREIEAGQSMSFANTKKEVTETVPEVTETTTPEIKPEQNMGTTQPEPLMSNSSVSTAPNNGHSAVLKITAIVAVIIIIAVGGTLAYAKWGGSNALSIFEDVVEAMEKTSSFSYSLETKITVKDSPSDNLDMSISGKVSITDKIVDKADLTVKATMGEDTENNSVQASVKMPGDENLYVQVTSVPAILSMFIDFSPIIGNWFSIPISQGLETLTTSAPIPVPVDSFDNETYQKIYPIFQKNNPIKAEKDGVEEISGVKTRKYKISIDQGKLLKFITEAQKEVTGNDLSDSEIAELNNASSDLDKILLYAFIGTKDNLLYRLNLKATDITSTPAIMSADLDVTLNITNYNVPVEIYPPDEWMTFEELMGVFSSSNPKRIIESYLLDIGNYAYYESIDNKNYNGVCGANKKTQSADIKKVLSKITIDFPEAKIVCGKPATGNATDWAVSVEIPEEGIFCIDSKDDTRVREIIAPIKSTTLACPLKIN